MLPTDAPPEPPPKKIEPPPTAEEELRVARQYLAAVEAKHAAIAEASRQRNIAEQQLQIANQLAVRIDENVLIPRTVVVETERGISLEAIKKTIAPDLSIRAITHVLKYYGQERTLVQYGSSPNAVTRPFTRAGLEEVFTRFRREAVKSVSATRKGIVLRHDSLLGDTALVSKADAVRYYGFATRQFDADQSRLI